MRFAQILAVFVGLILEYGVVLNDFAAQLQDQLLAAHRRVRAQANDEADVLRLQPAGLQFLDDKGRYLAQW